MWWTEVGSIGARALPAPQVAWTTHLGPYDETLPACRAVPGWIQARGHELLAPAREIYRRDPSIEPDPSRHQTEIAWPIQ